MKKYYKKNVINGVAYFEEEKTGEPIERKVYEANGKYYVMWQGEKKYFHPNQILTLVKF